MPTLPTLTITDLETWDRALAAFGTTDNYKTWLRQAIRAEVLRREMVELQAAAEQTIAARAAELETFLDDAT